MVRNVARSYLSQTKELRNGALIEMADFSRTLGTDYYALNLHASVPQGSVWQCGSAPHPATDICTAPIQPPASHSCDAKVCFIFSFFLSLSFPLFLCSRLFSSYLPGLLTLGWPSSFYFHSICPGVYQHLSRSHHVRFVFTSVAKEIKADPLSVLSDSAVKLLHIPVDTKATSYIA